MTILDHLLQTLEAAAVYNTHDQSPPSAILWTDGERLWEPVIGRIAASRPGLFVLHPEGDGVTSGPSTWIRERLGHWQEDAVPVVYLPGVSRAQFRGAAGFPEDARHLFALQYLGQFCTQVNHKDWTPMALLASGEGGLGLRVARDQATRDAILTQLDALLGTEVDSLRGRHLEAADFHELSAGDSVRLVLDWMNAPEGAAERLGAGAWAALRNFARKELQVDPVKDGLLSAAEALSRAEGRWSLVWRRFEEAAGAFPGVREALEQVAPQDLFAEENPRLPAWNRRKEEELRTALLRLPDYPPAEAREVLAALATEHAPRAESVWARLKEAPLACALVSLGEMVEAMGAYTPGTGFASLTQAYLTEGWKVDAAARAAWSGVRQAGDVSALTAALRAVYAPWLEAEAERVQGMAEEYPQFKPEAAFALQPEAGRVILFVDGLRADVAKALEQALQERGMTVTTQPRWSALPTVTATAKPAWQPLAGLLEGGGACSEGFEPRLRESGKPLVTALFRKALPKLGLPWLPDDQPGDPAESAWTEAGSFDSYGHKLGAKMVQRVEEEIEAVLTRIEELVDAGWKRVTILTDHGWLWMPGGLPKRELPKHLTVSKWGRCAIPEAGSAHGYTLTPWFWGAEHAVLLAPGIGVFQNSCEYTHGGLSVQEALTLVLDVIPDSSGTREKVEILDLRWVGLRLKASLTPGVSGLTLDIRDKANDPSTSIFRENLEQLEKNPDDGGIVTLVVADDSRIGEAAFLVVLREGRVIAKRNITIGEEEDS